ncbi:hypothetical protein [Rhizorhabdus sp.]|uniref:hypothetical protein n=1 Tax=Rhizorhabdus sp. TaxID=1968843 RepID=UPI0019C79F45|nr:hypothetical protein [Rhizorhabdus sp.]MBD3762602.1 hypothetical protein [Rhizorhabdus sp.]
MMASDDPRAIAARLSLAMKKAVLRCSEASDWDKSGCGMARSWPDVVHGTSDRASYRTAEALFYRGLAEPTEPNGVRLTFLGLRVRARLVHEGWRI